MIARLSQRLRSLIKSGDDWGPARESDIATLGLLHRVRDEWQVRDHAQVDGRLSLVELLKTLDQRRLGATAAPTTAAREQRVERLPDERIDAAGRTRPLDTGFFARRHYLLDELTGFDDAVFVEVAYRCLLKRPADPVGYSGFHRPLADRTRDRVETLNALHASMEGRSQKVTVSGLRATLLWRRAEGLPVIGLAVEWVHAFVDVRRNARRLRLLEQRVIAATEAHAALASAVKTLEDPRGQVETAVFGLANRYRRLQVESRNRAAAAESRIAESTQRFDALEQLVRRQEARIDRLLADRDDDRAAGSARRPAATDRAPSAGRTSSDPSS